MLELHLLFVQQVQYIKQWTLSTMMSRAQDDHVIRGTNVQTPMEKLL